MAVKAIEFIQRSMLWNVSEMHLVNSIYVIHAICIMDITGQYILKDK